MGAPELRAGEQLAQVAAGVAAVDGGDVLGRSSATIPPPPLPPSGPRSINQSAVLITSRLCSDPRARCCPGRREQYVMPLVNLLVQFSYC